MKKLFVRFLFLCGVAAFIVNVAASSIDSTDKYAWSDQAGWINFNPTYGAVQVTNTGMFGNAWIDNYGWLNLQPTYAGVDNLIQDDPVLGCIGNLSGHAWNDKLGWLNFNDVYIDSGGYFHGIATGGLYGNVYFSATNFQLKTDWNPDCQSPVVVLSGMNTMEVPLGGPYSDPGFLWTDNIDGTGSITLSSSGSVDLFNLGVYTLEYWYTDGANNQSNILTRTVEVKDNISPVFTSVSVDTTSSIDLPTITFAATDNVAVDYFVIEYNTDDGIDGAGSGMPTVISGASVTSPISLLLDPDELTHIITLYAYDAAGNFVTKTLKFPPIVNFTAPTTISNAIINNSIVTITSPAGNPIDNISLDPDTTASIITNCIGSGSDTTVPYNSPVVCEINNIADSGEITVYAQDSVTSAQGENSQAYTVDLIAPGITEITPISTPTTDTTPNYTFYSSEAGTITYGGSCNSGFTGAIVGNNTITLNTLAQGTYNDCTITVTDAVGNTSNTLNITPFTVLNTYVVRFFQYDGITQIGSDQIVINGNDAIPPLPLNRIGYTFTGWSVGYTNITSQRDLIALYDVNQYTVTFFDYNGTLLDTQLITHGSGAIQPTDPTRVGHVFAGWNPSDFSSITTTTNIVAQWIAAQYALSFNVNGGTLVAPIIQDFGTSITPPITTKTGYTFASWSPAIPATMPAATQTHTANWTPNIYQISYLPNDGTGTMSSQNFMYATSQPLTSNTFVRSGYAFSGWNTQPNGVGVRYTNNQNVNNLTTVSGSLISLYAQWKDNQSPVITMSGNSIVTMLRNETYTDAGAECIDNVDTYCVVNVTGTVNTGTVGTYIITYSAIDLAGNSAIQFTRTVHVELGNAPVITLSGTSNLIVAQGSVYNDLGATASDVEQGDMTSSIIISGTVNTLTLGTYTIQYRVTDFQGNIGTGTRIVTVTDQTAPIPPLITSVGGDLLSPYKTALNTPTISGIAESGSLVKIIINTVAYTGYSNNSGHYSIVISPALSDANYTMSITAMDVAGNISNPTVKLFLIDTTPATLLLIGQNPIEIEYGGNIVDEGALRTDAVDGTGLVMGIISGGMSTTVPGIYTGIYSHTDNLGNIAMPITRTFIVKDAKFGGGGSRNSGQKDNCPDGDISDSYYDGNCRNTIKPNISNAENTIKDVVTSSDDQNTIEDILPGSSACITGTELQKAYCFARKYDITTIDSLLKASPNGSLIRKDLAKMMVNFSLNVLGKNKPTISPVCETAYADVETASLEAKDYIKLACSMGIMGLYSDGETLLDVFRPDDKVTRAEFATVLSRSLYGHTYDVGLGAEENWYQNHLDNLKKLGYLKNIQGSRPLSIELRGYTWIVLERIASSKNL